MPDDCDCSTFVDLQTRFLAEGQNVSDGKLRRMLRHLVSTGFVEHCRNHPRNYIATAAGVEMVQLGWDKDNRPDA